MLNKNNLLQTAYSSGDTRYYRSYKYRVNSSSILASSNTSPFAATHRKPLPYNSSAKRQSHSYMKQSKLSIGA